MALFVVVCATPRDLCATAAQSGPVLEFAGRSVQLSLERIDDRTSTPWPGGDVRLTTKPVMLTAESSIGAELAAAGIEPNGDAYSLVYDLNPKLQPSTNATGHIVIPVIQAPPMISATLGKEYLVVLTLDPQIRDELIQTAGQIQALATPSPRENPQVRMSIEDLTRWYSAIRTAAQRHRDPALTLETRLQLRDEASALVPLLAKAAQDGPRLSKADADQIAAIHSDVQREIRRYDDVMSGQIPDPDLMRCCTIRVTIVGATSEQLQRVRVYYTLNGLFHHPPPAPLRIKPFPELGSGSSDLLQAKIYRIWVAPDGKPDELLTTDGLLVDLTAADKEKNVQLRLAAAGRMH